MYLLKQDIKVPRRSEGLESLTQSLSNYGISRGNIHNWKAIMLLLGLFYQQSDIRRYIITQLREVYNYRIGEILDSLNSFQLANYLMELIVNCFPKKHNSRATVLSAPQFWRDPAKTKSFFSDELYPHWAKHGEDVIIQLVLSRFGNFFTNFGSVKKAIYIIGKSSGVKTLTKHQSYLQVLHQSLYFWDGEGLFFEINPRKVTITRDLRDTLKVTLNDTFSNCILSPHSAWLTTLNKTTSFQFQTNEPSTSEMIWNATKLPKISEVQTYISLRFPSSFDDGIIQSSVQESGAHTNNDPIPNTGKNPIEGSSFAMGQVTDTFGTPNKTSDSYIGGQGMEQVIDDSVFSSSQAPETPRKLKMSVFDDSIEHDDQSPLAIAQKRKIVRATSKTLGVLKEEFKRQEPVNVISSAYDIPEEVEEADISPLKPPPPPPANIFQSKTTKPVPAKDNLSGVKKVTDMFKPLMKKKEAAVLDDIFALPLPKGKKKKNDSEKKQSVLNNFRPVVYVSSQDQPPAKSKLVAAVNKNNKLVVKKKVAVVPTVPEGAISKKRKRVENNEDVFALSGDDEQTPPKRVTRSAKGKKGEAVSLETKTISDAPSSTPHPKTTDAPNRTGGSNSVLNGNNAANAVEPTPEKDISNKGDENKTRDDSTLRNDKSMMNESTNTDISMLNSITATTPFTSGYSKMPAFQGSFTNQLQEQIYHSVMNFSNELARKISLINGEMNKKIVNELSEKYKTMFQELQSSFQNDVEKITGFVGEIKDMLHLPEEELLKLIRDKQFHT